MLWDIFTSYGLLMASVLFVLAAVCPVIYERLIVPNLSLERQADFAENRWREQRQREGRTVDEIYLEDYVRNALAEIQEQASEAIYCNDGTDIDKQINQIGMLQIELLTGLNPTYGCTLTNVLRDTRKDELIYPDALAELERQYRSKERPRPDGWAPTRGCPARKPTQEQLERAAWIRLNAFTMRY